MLKFRHAAIALTLLAGTAAASAQTTVITQPVQTQTVVTTQRPLVLTPDQRQIVYRDIVRERTTTGAPGTVEYRVGTRVPGTVQLYSVPESVAVAVPAIKQYRYMVVNDRVVLVDPATSEVVEELSE
jgi:cell division protein FtsL